MRSIIEWIIELLPDEFGPYINVIGARVSDCHSENALKFLILSDVNISGFPSIRQISMMAQDCHFALDDLTARSENSYAY